MTTPAYDYIKDNEALRQFCSNLADCEYIVLDTEFIREKTFLPELCLVQIKSGDELAIVDTQSVNDLTPLSALLADQQITKVFHAGSQDLEIFYWLDKAVPTPIFDTQVAAPLLGFADQIGYGNLVSEYLGVSLSKAHSRADWSRRPLPEKQLQYALDDVIYLEELYLKMFDELTSKNRMEWIQPELDALTEAQRYDKPAGDRWKKMHAAQKMKGSSLSVLQSLTEWREIQAKESNIPRNWLLKDDVLASIARELPVNETDLSHIRGLSGRIKTHLSRDVLNLIKVAREEDPEPMPKAERKRKIKPEQLPAIELLWAVVTHRAIEADINPVALASRKDLEKCVAAGSASPLSGWRQKIIGGDITALLAGELKLRLHNGRVVIE